MVDGSLTHPATVAVEPADLMLLRAPINAHKPLIRHVMIVLLWMSGGLHDKAHRSLTSLIRIVLCGALPWLLFGPVLALAAQLPTGCAPRDTRWGTSPTEGLEAQGTYGTPSEVTRNDHCNRRLLRWYRAPKHDSLQLLGRLHQPLQHRLGVHLKPPGGGAKAQPFSQTGQHAHDQFHRQAFTMPERAVRLQEVAVTRATVQLAPQATAGMAVGVEVAEDVSQVSIPDHRACPNSYRLMKS